MIPLRVHGDGAEFLARDSMTSVSMTGLGAVGKTKALTLNLASFPLSICAKQNAHGKDSWNEIWKVLRWSFNALAEGRFPSVD
eukprot:2587501-Pyramimonas_sp.AAC.1